MASLLYEGFEAAVLDAREYFEARKVPIDPHLFAHLVRFALKNWLNAQGHASEDTVDYQVEHLALSGIRFVFDHWDVRVFKAVDAKRFDGTPFLALPAPGRSQAKQDFYQQQLELFAPDGSARPVLLNMVIVWELTSGWNVRLFLACPKDGGNSRTSVEMFWPDVVEIPHPTTAAVPSAVAAVEDLELESVADATGTETGND